MGTAALGQIVILRPDIRGGGGGDHFNAFITDTVFETYFVCIFRPPANTKQYDLQGSMTDQLV